MTHSNDETFWRTKLAARLHDPAEKALVLLRDPAGHENGTSRALQRLLAAALPTADIDPDNDEALIRVVWKDAPLSRGTYVHVRRADWWAAAADRPQFPLQEISVATKTGEVKTIAIAKGSRINWAKEPVLIHPLTGDELHLKAYGDLQGIETADVKRRSFDHHSALLKALPAVDSADAARKALLAFWRFGPELREEDDHNKLGALWQMLPADTRIPDHSIWDHLDLTSAFAGAFAADPNGEAALLTLSIGPVQGFIATARSTSDLWAGSHLLSRLAWEVMRPLAEDLGPDAILFPRLRGIPQVDVWLQTQMGLPAGLFADCAWRRTATDANPLFSAALPNRFVALVPASRAQEIAEKCKDTVREWLQKTGEEAVDALLAVAGIDKDKNLPCYRQMHEQLAGFPEVHWAAVPFSLIGVGDTARQRDLDTTALQAAMAPFYGSAPEVASGFLASQAWQLLQKNLAWDDATTFFAPNPGVLYPAVHELAERMHAAAKAARPFEALAQTGWRCSLSGESEWLTTDREQLKTSYRQQNDTLWARIHRRKPSWAKKGEHLGGLAALKRLWPTLFVQEVSPLIDEDKAGGGNINRFVVSTHTMALAHQIEQWLERGGLIAPGLAERLDADTTERVALPRRLLHEYSEPETRAALADARLLPGLLDAARESEDEAQLHTAHTLVKQTLGVDRLETYYALIMMDGDRMGAILSGDPGNVIPYAQSFHPTLRKGFLEHAARQPRIKRYAEMKRAISPNRHLAISGALNDFSQTVVPHVVEREHLGRVIYAGGDDVLAMLPVADMLSAMQRLRHAYSGTLPENENLQWDEMRKTAKGKLACKNGFAWLDGRLMRMMGRHATASCGTIVAHHQAPLAAVLRELRAAEQRAKQEGGRDAFAITVVKRGGGALYLTAKWGEPVALLKDCMHFLAAPGTSRRAVYNSLEWLRDLPAPSDDARCAMLASLLAYQLARQAKGAGKAQAECLAQRLATLAQQVEQGGVAGDNAPSRTDPSTPRSHGAATPPGRWQASPGLDWLGNFLSVAEFLARATRHGDAP